MKFLKDEAGEIDSGKTSTVLISIVTPILGLIVTVLLQTLINEPLVLYNILDQYGLAIYAPLVASFLVTIYNMRNPRSNEESVDKQ